MISAQQFELLQVPQDAVVEGAVTDLAQLRGRRNSAFIIAGEQIPISRVETGEIPGGALGIPEDEADRIKRGEVVEGGPAPADAQRVAQGRTVSFVDEIRSSLEFYAAQSPGSRIGKLRVTGGGSKLPGFVQLLQERLGLLVEWYDPMAFVKATRGAGLHPEEQLSLAVVAGLCTGVTR